MSNSRQSKKLMRNGVLTMLLCLSFSSQLIAQTILVEGESFTNSCCGDGKVEYENGGASIGYFDNLGEMLTYSINVPTAGYYNFSFKYLSGDAGSITVRTAQDAEGAINFDAVTNPGGDWWELPISQWPTTNSNTLFYLQSGTQNLYLINQGVGFNIDYFNISYSSNQAVTVNRIEVTPTPLEVKPDHSAILKATAFSGSDIVAVPLTWSSNAPGGEYNAGATGSDVVSVGYNGLIVNVPVIIQMPQKKQNFVVNHHGDLRISTDGSGGIWDKNNQKASFAGPSWFWSCSAPKYWTKEAVNFFVNDWKSGIIRLPMSIGPGLYDDKTHQYTGSTWNTDNYYHNPESSLERMKTMIDAAIENDVYVVVDFHEHHAQNFIQEAQTFFRDIASMYGHYDNVIFEIYNEPLGDSDHTTRTPWSEVERFANAVIPVIREHSDNLIIVGSPSWSQEIEAAGSVLDHYGNIAYTLHYYAAQHGNSLTGKMNLGKPVMITECGNDGWAQDDYIRIAKEKGISMMSWAVNNKGRNPDGTDGDIKWSVFTADNQNFSGNWTDADFSDAGRTQRGIIQSWPRAVEPDPICTNNVFSQLILTAPKTMLLIGEEITLSAKGRSTCKDVPLPGPIDWTNADNGVFSSDVVGEFVVTACVNGICDDVTLTVDSVVLTNMLLNGDFENNDANWTTFVYDGVASGNVSVVNGEMVAAISNGGTADWNVQLYQTGLNIENGKSYRVSFDAKADAARSIKAQVEMNGDPYTTYGGGDVSLTNQMANYSYEFTMNEATDPAARISFNLGANNADVTIDNVILSEVGGINLAPIAVVGANQVLPVGTTSASLQGSDSYDPDNGPSMLTYAWTQVSGPSTTISDATAANPTVSGLNNGTSYTFQLVVNDGDKASEAQTIIIEVESPATNLLVNGNFTNVIDPWTSYIHTAAANANVSVVNNELVANISNGGTEGWNVQVYQGGLNIEKDKTYRVSFNAKATANRSITCLVEKDGDPYTTYGGSNNNISLTTAMTPFEFEFTMNEATDPAARLTFNLGTNNANVTIDNVVIIESGNNKPNVDAGQNQNLPAETTCVTLEGTASDNDGPSPLTYLWTQTSGPAATIADPTSLSTEVCGLANGNVYTFQLSANDGEDVSSDEVTISVGASTYALEVIKNGTGSGSVTPANGDYPAGQELTITATADASSVFAGWSGDVTSSSSSITVTMNSDVNLVATFNEKGVIPPYPYGIVPSVANEGEAQAAYDAFIANFYEECGDGYKARIKWGYPGRGDNPAQTVSEGIAYGMLLTAYFNDQDKFNKLWNYYKSNSTDGLMDWKISGCSGIVEGGPASDAEVDAAFALIVADSKWGGYRYDTETLINNIKYQEIIDHILKPGRWGGYETVNISYFAPGYFKAFGTYMNDSDFWNAVADKCYEIMDTHQRVTGATGGLVADFCKADGHDWGGRNQYKYDACRTPWRIAMDYVWYGDNRAKAYLDKTNGFIAGKGGINQMVDGYNLDGSEIAGERYHNTTFVANFACAGVALSDESLMNTYYNEFNVEVSPWSYFDFSFDALGKLLLSGLMQNPEIDNKVNLNVSTNGSGSVTLSPAGGRYDIGTIVTLTPVGEFQGWSGDASGNDNPLTVIVNSNMSITANFSGIDPIHIEAETYSATGSVSGGEGVQTENCSEGGQNIGWVDAGDWTTYDNVNLAPGTYTVEIRYAGYGGQVQFEQAGGTPAYGVVDIPARPEPNAWQNWASVTATIVITEQTTNLGVYFPDGDININWYKFTPVSGAKSTREDKLALAIDNETFANFELKAYPNPVTTELKVSGLENVNNLTIFNLRGQQLIMKELDGSNETTINVETLQKGIFLIKASKAGEIRTLKFIKK